MRHGTGAGLATAMTIGELAGALAVNVETIRYYERIGLIEQPPKPESGHRRYGPDVVGRVQLIQRLKALGFSLKDIGDLLAIEGACCEEVRSRAEDKRSRLDEQIRDLVALRRALDHLIERCEKVNGAGSCSLIDTLGTDSGNRLRTKLRDYII